MKHPVKDHAKWVKAKSPCPECPRCKVPVKWDRDTYRCDQCGRRYQIASAGGLVEPNVYAKGDG